MRVCAATFTLALAFVGAVPARAAEPAFVGSWGESKADCKTPFRFTATSYSPPGRKALRIRSIERDGASYLLTFPDGYRVSLFEVTKQTMTWHSPVSGDTFDLIRCR